MKEEDKIVYPASGICGEAGKIVNKIKKLIIKNMKKIKLSPGSITIDSSMTTNVTTNEAYVPKTTETVGENNIYFWVNGDPKPIMKIVSGKFYWKEEEIDDIHNVYDRFNEWLGKTEVK